MLIPRPRGCRRMHPPRILREGQLWRVSAGCRGGTIEVRIESMETDPRLGLMCVCRSVHSEIVKRIKAPSLRAGRLGALLLREPDGSEPAEYEPYPAPPPKAEGPRKIRTFLPKGVLRRDITLFETKCSQLRARGMGPKEMALHLGEPEHKVKTALKNYDDIRANRALLAASGC